MYYLRWKVFSRPVFHAGSQGDNMGSHDSGVLCYFLVVDTSKDDTA